MKTFWSYATKYFVGEQFAIVIVGEKIGSTYAPEWFVCSHLQCVILKRFEFLQENGWFWCSSLVESQKFRFTLSLFNLNEITKTNLGTMWQYQLYYFRNINSYLVYKCEWKTVISTKMLSKIMYNSERIIMIVRPAIAVENLEQVCVCRN